MAAILAGCSSGSGSAASLNLVIVDAKAFDAVSVHIGYAIICGILLALVYYYSGSIWVSYIVHAVFNLIGNAIFTLLKSGMFGDMSAAVEQASMHTAVIEIFCILPAAAAFVLVYRRYKVRNDNKIPDVNTVEAGAVI